MEISYLPVLFLKHFNQYTMHISMAGHLKNAEKPKWICDIKTGNEITMHMVEDQLRHGRKAKRT